MREINELLLMKSTNHSYLYRLNKTKNLTLQRLDRTSKSTKLDNTNLKNTQSYSVTQFTVI